MVYIILHFKDMQTLTSYPPLNSPTLNPDHEWMVEDPIPYCK
jgi:hypothetical protein